MHFGVKILYKKTSTTGPNISFNLKHIKKQILLLKGKLIKISKNYLSSTLESFGYFALERNHYPKSYNLSGDLVLALACITEFSKFYIKPMICDFSLIQSPRTFRPCPEKVANCRNSNLPCLAVAQIKSFQKVIFLSK